MRRLVIGVLVLAALSTVTRQALGSTLQAGDVLEIRFRTTGLVCYSAIDLLQVAPCNFLRIYPAGEGSFNTANFTANLFNGNALLGTFFTPVCCLADFVAPSTPFSFLSTIVDFTAIDAGTINGILDLSIGKGTLIWPAGPMAQLFIGRVIVPDGYVLGGSGFQIQSITILSVPEPSTLLLVIAGLLLIGSWGYAGTRLVTKNAK